MKRKAERKRWIIGVDEAGRGPLAGPVAVGVAVVPKDFNWGMIPGVGDSKKVSPKHREMIYRRAQDLKKQGLLDFHVALISNVTVDRNSISYAVSLGIERCLNKIKIDPKTADVRLDGLLKAPPEYKVQQTIIKGDAKEKIIGLASIMAKVTRDRYMVQKAKKYPKYSFEIHKGYGTKKHCEALRKYGLSFIHRKSFCKKITAACLS